MSILKEFQEFAVKGNVVDLAVGVIIGAAFGGIVGSIVDDLFMPIVGAVLGGLDFSNYYIPLSDKVTATSLAEAKKQGAVLAYGSFLTKLVNLLIIAWILFLVVKGINRLRRQFEAQAEAAPAVEAPADVKLLTEIRDLLASEQKAAPSRK
jgi:large conductance mechanosensitive channel